MLITLREASSGDERKVQVAKNDFIVSLKTLSQSIFPNTVGKLIKLVVLGVSNQTELEDAKYVGDYHSLISGCIVEIITPDNQPFSKVNYALLERSVEEEHKEDRKQVKDFYDPKLSQTENDWNETWNKGDEYLNYPLPATPSDVEAGGRNIWENSKNVGRVDDVVNADGSGKNMNIVNVPRKTQRQRGRLSSSHGMSWYDSMGFTAQGNQSAENGMDVGQPGYKFDFEKMFGELLERGRSFHSVYISKVRGFVFHTVHKIEGKWSGTATHFTTSFNGNDTKGEKDNKQIIHACGSRLVFDPKSRSWLEQQSYTNEAGMSSSRVFRYVPVSDSVCLVETESVDFGTERGVKLKLVEQNDDNVVLLTGVNVKTGKNLFVETIVLNGTEERVRTITRFDADGNVVGVVLCNEKKVIDAETGALEKPYF